MPRPFPLIAQGRCFPVLLAAMLALLLAPGSSARDPEPIRVGVLHSLSGTMAISETTLKDTVLMLVEQQNARGGLLGRPLEAVVVDPSASTKPLCAALDRIKTSA